MTDNTLLTTTEAASYLRLSPRTLDNWRSRKTGPAYVKLGDRVLYRKSDLDSWLEQQRQN